MAKPLRSDETTPKSVQFSHFGVLEDKQKTTGAFTTSIIANVAILALVIFLGTLVKNKIAPPKVAKDVSFVEPVKPPPPPKPPPVKLPPPPKLPDVKIPDPPKIKLPDPVKLPPDIKPVVVPVPKVNLAPPAPMKVDPPPAPKVVSLASKAAAASVINNDAHPSAVRLGSATSPISSSMTGPAVSRVNMSAGMAGMPPANSGSGPRATSVNMGNGSPQGNNLAGKSVSPVKIAGSPFGVPGGTGKGTGGPVAVQIAPPVQQVAAARPVAASTVAASAPKVTYKPTPVYTAEAKQMHLEGNVSIKIKVTASGAVEVLGVTHGLGHGLDQSAIQAIQGTRFQPAKNAAGTPVDWEGVVTVSFQLS